MIAVNYEFLNERKSKKLDKSYKRKLLQGEKTVSTHQRYPLSLPAGSSNLAAAL